MNHYWQRIADFWAEREEMILSAPRDAWAVGVYEWDGVIQMTPIEQWLWGDIRELNAVFYPQWPVGGFFVDFANPVAMVAIECDGAAYHLDKDKDAARDRKLKDLGWDVYRFTGKQCRWERDEETLAPTHTFQVLEQICNAYGLKRTRESVKAWSQIIAEAA